MGQGQGEGQGQGQGKGKGGGSSTPRAQCHQRHLRLTRDRAGGSGILWRTASLVSRRSKIAYS
jgi:hypothetical protein